MSINEKTAIEHVEDFFEGMYDTAIKAPIAFGDFLARVSGYRDYQFTKDSVLDLNTKLKSISFKLCGIYMLNIAKELKYLNLSFY